MTTLSRRHRLKPQDGEVAKVLVLQSVLRVWFAARDAEKRIKRHALRTKIANELLDTELSYLRDIRTIYQEFQLQSGDVLSRDEQQIVFMNIKELIPIHTDLVKELQLKIGTWGYHQTLADTIQAQVRRFKIYKGYITNYKEATDFLQKQRSSSAKLDKFLHERESNPYCRNLKLESFLIMPVQRLPRYILLLKELRKYTDPAHPDFAKINSALLDLDLVTKNLNEQQREKEMTQKIAQIKGTVQGIEEVALESPFIFEGELAYKRAKVKGFMANLSLRKSSEAGFLQNEWKQVFVYLFKDTMLCAKKISTTSAKTILGALHGKGFYKFSNAKAILLRTNTILDASAENQCDFRVVNDHEILEFRAATPQLRKSWISAFEKTLVFKR